MSAVPQGKAVGTCRGFWFVRTASERDAFKVHKAGDDSARESYEDRFSGAHHTCSKNVSCERLKIIQELRRSEVTADVMYDAEA